MVGKSASSSSPAEVSVRVSQRLSKLVGDWKDAMEAYEDVFNTAMLRPTLTSTRSQHNLLVLVVALHTHISANPSGLCLSDEQTDVQAAAVELMRGFNDLTPLLEQMYAEISGNDAILAELAAARISAKAAEADARAVAEAESVLGDSISSLLPGAARTAIIVEKKIELSFERQAAKAKARRAQAEANVAARRNNRSSSGATSLPSPGPHSPLPPLARRQPSVSASYKPTIGLQQLNMLLLKRPILAPLTTAPTSLPQVRIGGRALPLMDSPIASPSHSGAPSSPPYARRSDSSSDLSPSPIQSPTGVELRERFSPLSSPSRTAKQ